MAARGWEARSSSAAAPAGAGACPGTAAVAAVAAAAAVASAVAAAAAVASAPAGASSAAAAPAAAVAAGAPWAVVAVVVGAAASAEAAVAAGAPAAVAAAQIAAESAAHLAAAPAAEILPPLHSRWDTGERRQTRAVLRSWQAATSGADARAHPRTSSGKHPRHAPRQAYLWTAAPHMASACRAGWLGCTRRIRWHWSSAQAQGGTRTTGSGGQAYCC